MRDILKTEEHVAVPPETMADPFYRMTYILKDEIRKYKWTEAERGNNLSWDEAARRWMNNHAHQIDRFYHDTLHFKITREPFISVH